MLFENNDFELDFPFLNLVGLTTNNKINNSPNTKPNMNSNFLTAKEGFLRGNMFKNEYKPYKNLTYIDIKPKNDREAKLFNVMSFSFAINDMNLYLDTHPDDTSALYFLEELIKEEHKAKEEYMKTYGPLTVNKTKGDKFTWLDSPWPWEDLGGSMYV